MFNILSQGAKWTKKHSQRGRREEVVDRDEQLNFLGRNIELLNLIESIHIHLELFPPNLIGRATCFPSLQRRSPFRWRRLVILILFEPFRITGRSPYAS